MGRLSSLWDISGFLISSLFLTSLVQIILLTCSLFSVHQLIDIWVVSSFLVIMNNVVMNICVQVFVFVCMCVLFYFSLGVEHI